MIQLKKILALTGAFTLAAAISAQVNADTTVPVEPEVVKPAKELLANGFAGKAMRFAQALNLTEEQKIAIETALLEIRASLPARDAVSADEFIEAQVAAREAAKEAINGVLTAEQKELLLTLQTRAHREHVDGPKPVKPVPDTAPVPPVKPTPPEKPVPPVVGEKPVKPTPPVTPVPPVEGEKPVKPTPPEKPVKPVKPVKPTLPETPTTPVVIPA